MLEIPRVAAQECAMGEASLFNPQQQAQIALAEQAPSGADMLLFMAQRFWRAGLAAQFAECFRRAYVLAPSPATAQQLLGEVESEARWHDVQAMTAALVAHGCAYSAMLAQLAVMALDFGDTQVVRQLTDPAHVFRHGTCAPPAGQDIDAFHDAVAAEIKSKLTYYDTPSERSIRKGYRRNHVMKATSPAMAALQGMLRGLVDDYLAALPHDPANPFLAMRPAAPVINAWAVISTPDSHHTPHIHPDAWATGVYYVSEPAISRSSDKGWLEIGPPPPHTGAGWETRRIAPRRGSFILMPAYFHHWTAPMGVDEERICIAFEAGYPELYDAKAVARRA
jgi:hypothetical protein